MKTSHILLVILIALLAGFGGAKLAAKSDSTQTAKAETAYERVMRTQTLRCGYAVWSGVVMKNDNGQLYGPWVDLTNELGKATGLKVEWVSEVDWGGIGAALKSNKIDAMCAGLWSSATKAKEISFTTPVAYQALEVFVRNNDHRFDGDQSLLNNKEIKLAVLENDNSDFISQSDFPNAQRNVLSTLTGSDADLVLNVATNKADATFTSAGFWHDFEKTNPGQVRRLFPGRYLRVFGLTYGVNNDDIRLTNLLNAGVSEMLNSGTVNRILDSADKDYPDTYIRAAKTYQ